MKIRQENLEKIKRETSYQKIVEMKVFETLFKVFQYTDEKKDYPCMIDHVLDIALNFYKCYNLTYYANIIKALHNGQIMIGKELNHSYSTKDGKTYICYTGNDSDLFLIVHEFAHFIDRSSTPHLIPDQFWFLSEVFSFYMEKKLELWLNNEYPKLTYARRENRLYFESQMIKAIQYQLKYEAIFLEKGFLNESDINPKEWNIIKKYNYPNLVNYLVMYPLANIISEYLIHHYPEQSDEELYLLCLKTNLYEMIEEFQRKLSREK